MGVMVNELQQELNRIARYWSKMMDKEYGGYYGYVDYNLNLDKKSPKGGILNSRILWFSSSLYCLNKDKDALTMAQQAYEFLKTKLWDNEYKGIYWLVDYDGSLLDTRKHSYCQAFAIYGLTQYYRATGSKEALNLAIEIYNLIEKYCKDQNGYTEEFTREWKTKENEMLSENGVMTEKTMNTHLHILEAYTVLYDVWKDEGLKKQLNYLLEIVYEKIYDNSKHYLKVFFDKKWNSLLDMQSYGHDIEATWLIDRAAEVLGDKELIRNTFEYTQKIAQNIYDKAYSPKGMINETVNDKTDKKRVWWVQAEAVIGFYNAYQKTGDTKFKDASESMWNYIKNYLIDKREGSEWYWLLDENSKPVAGKPIVEPWKCPYHNGRMCMEMIERIGKYV
ncbi:cellobiose 2-epimerase [Clostridium oryzae]|uniref:Cellobiose 2-epimerase n=2 Tax=Clostridium oryzae TaxID=1450648 RepID=A0A1V4IEB3_9CLOT|nr:cellobiose 2-epimerase [Clostridium oryzae]